MKLLSELIVELEGKELYNEITDPPIRDIAYDSRQVIPGSLFVCIRGLRTDGHLYVREALSRGALAVVSERLLLLPAGIPGVLVPDTRLALAQMGAAFHGYPGRQLRVIGITGTNGKTSSTHFLEAILSGWGKKTGLLGTITNRLGGRKLPSSLTTPESLDLQGFLAEMVRKECSYMVMEVSSHALSLLRVQETEFDIGVFTNLTRDHLDFHRDFEDYREAKGILFKQLGLGEKKSPKYAVMNGDDPHCNYYRQITRVPVYTYGIKKNSDFQAEEVRITPKSASFNLEKFSERIYLRVTGLFSVYNALAAIAVAVREGVPPEIIAGALRDFPGVPGRF
ncbi:MAG TPA: UDP-N-acetylmuramoyl-L-alanyl-D-glutamate--2,6-diaminopimelate ligase, partial [Clostridia bacterium]|nr:UDP-N-acetylmuramoyl-L-alanyl-D-glutamate--2,6-diaminopimelate ligase [Clostridia bacterium]